jgi:signal transduction histidine kinase
MRLSTQRFRPSSWGALPLFLALLLPIRWMLGGPVLPWHWFALLGAVTLLLGYYILTPLPWLWSGDDRPRIGLFRGTFQALLWNTLWLGSFALLHQLIGGPEPPRVADAMHGFALRASVPLPVFRVLVQLPFACLAGWFIAEMEARGLERTSLEAARRNLETQAREAEAQALRAQLDPHVLYNALGALSELARENPAATEEALLDFSDLYRRLTVLRERPFIRLEEERELLERYLAIEALRLGPRLQVEWAWPEALSTLGVPPLLVLPLVENALKHGLAPERSGGKLRLEAGRMPDRWLRVRILNTGRPLSAGAEPPGTGLRNLRARLALLGSGHSSIDLRSEGGWTVAELNLEDTALQELP